MNQALFDGGQTRNAVRSARSLAICQAERIASRARKSCWRSSKAYLDSTLSHEALHAASDAVKSAEADLAQAESIRQAGMSTDADVLSIRVHLADVREQPIRDFAVAQAALNDALGLPLESRHELSTPLSLVRMPERRLEDAEQLAASRRPEQLRMKEAADLASTQVAAARSSLLLKASVRGAFEGDRQDFISRGEATGWARFL